MEVIEHTTQLFIMQDYAKDLLLNSVTDTQIESARSFLSRIEEEMKTLCVPTAIENA